MASPLRASRAASARARNRGRLRGRPYWGVRGGGASELLGSGDGLHEESRGGGGGGGNDDVDGGACKSHFENRVSKL